MLTFEQKAAPYLQLGWPVFPLRPGTNGFFSKAEEPKLPNGGFHWATLDAAKIANWSYRWHEANIALRTGEASGVVVIDLDFGKPNSNTQEALDLLSARGYCFPPASVIARTPSGGVHLYYRRTGPLRCSVSRLGSTLIGPGRKSCIDVRADGGCTVLPPTTVHGKGEYTWVKPPWGVRLLPLPRWVMDQLADKPADERLRPYVAPVRSNLSDIPDWRLQKVATTPVNTSRNQTLFRQVAQAADYGHSHAEIEAKFLEAALASGLDVREARKTIRSALRPDARRDPRRRTR